VSFQFEILTSGKLRHEVRVGFSEVVLVGIYAPAAGSYSEPDPHCRFVTVRLNFSTGSRLTARSRGQPDSRRKVVGWSLDRGLQA
jgi:hypothetical protein